MVESATRRRVESWTGDIIPIVSPIAGIDGRPSRVTLDCERPRSLPRRVHRRRRTADGRHAGRFASIAVRLGRVFVPTDLDTGFRRQRNGTDHIRPVRDVHVALDGAVGRRAPLGAVGRCVCADAAARSRGLWKILSLPRSPSLAAIARHVVAQRWSTGGWTWKRGRRLRPSCRELQMASYHRPSSIDGATCARKPR